MRRELPQRPNLEHLKSQAKDLLDAHRRRDREALERIRATVPAFANRSDDAIADAAFALHDAQSAIAREYGFASWAALRAHLSGAPQVAGPTALPQDIPPELARLVEAAVQQRGVGADQPTPATAPVLPLRNSVIMLGAIMPLDIKRATSMRAIEAAMSRTPHFVAIFAQREMATENPSTDDLHPVGTLAIIRVFEGDATQGRVIVEGIRWIALDELQQREPYYLASIIDTANVRADDAALVELDRKLRDAARKVADLLGDNREQAHALIEGEPDPVQLANIVMAHFQLPVAELAAFAAESDSERRIERAIAVLETALRNPPPP